MPAVSTPSTPTRSKPARAKRVRNIRAIRRGDHIEVRSGSEVYYRGEVRDTAPGLGTVWIREDDAGTRTAVSVEDFTIWKIPA
ncbi:hypothetical protein QNO08_15740 [Arthrobacter sp. zg-Y820]|uniref:hypothetical protein n=1 Tax=unclassified Arthrobacter TaxID=235627 RepID=UPI001E6526C5|nr:MULTISPECIES: hypothetical protein [unclassified Arthrobacter]MCC9197091.1 hypothetical protein [Arthrobacter sp. zg-Y820]MDK1279956.1 hypothetical protein [Arthrobacter sp. zg.Y820]WIB09255.1 hypothetical protein QNO08_15740 [Arthrobacter sp. zg-Y820]